MAADSVLLILLVLWVSGRAGAAFRLSLAELIVPWAYLLVNKAIEYKSVFKNLGMSCFRRSFCGFQRPLISTFLDGKPFRPEPFDFSRWSDPNYLNANIMTVICAVCVLWQ